jgi:hypothetical protein
MSKDKIQNTFGKYLEKLKIKLFLLPYIHNTGIRAAKNLRKGNPLSLLFR